MTSIDALDPKELTKRFRDASRMFQRYFRKSWFLGPLKVTKIAPNGRFDENFVMEGSVPMCADTFLGCNMISTRDLDPKGGRNRFGNLLRMFRHHF